MSTSKKPLIIVTGPDKRLRFGWWATRFMLRLVGLRGFYVSPGTQELPAKASGIIIGGGDDIEPTHYGELGDAGTHYDPERDRLEMAMVKRALESGVPILGICRGAQLMNVAMGGSLHTDIRPCRQVTPNKNSLFPIKWADLHPRSLIHKLTNQCSIRINSLHNQAVKDVAPGLRVAARDKDCFIQAVEAPQQQRYILGVQWHPEYMPYDRHQRQLFYGFAQAVSSSDRVLAS